MAKHLQKFNKFLAAKGVQIFARDSYATLRVAPVAMYGQRALGGVAQAVTALNETDNPEAILTELGSNGYVGYVFGFAVVCAQTGANTPSELAAMAANMFVRYESAGIVRNIPVSSCINFLGGSSGTQPLIATSAPNLSYYRSPNALEWDGTNSSSVITLVNGPAAATAAGQEFTLLVDGWFAPKTEASLMPLFYPVCGEDDSTAKFLEELIRTAKILTAVRTGMGTKLGALKA